MNKSLRVKDTTTECVFLVDTKQGKTMEYWLKNIKAEQKKLIEGLGCRWNPDVGRWSVRSSNKELCRELIAIGIELSTVQLTKETKTIQEILKK